MIVRAWEARCGGALRRRGAAACCGGAAYPSYTSIHVVSSSSTIHVIKNQRHARMCATYMSCGDSACAHTPREQRGSGSGRTAAAVLLTRPALGWNNAHLQEQLDHAQRAQVHVECLLKPPTQCGTRARDAPHRNTERRAACCCSPCVGARALEAHALEARALEAVVTDAM